MADLRPWTPFALSLDIERKIDEAFSTLIDEPWGRLSSAWQPAIDVLETHDAYLIEVDLPGVSPEQVEIHVEGNRLTIRGARHATLRAETARSLRVERTFGSFCRTLDLAHAVDPERLEKHVEHGILHARLPKRSPPAVPSAGAPKG